MSYKRTVSLLRRQLTQSGWNNFAIACAKELQDQANRRVSVTVTAASRLVRGGSESGLPPAESSQEEDTILASVTSAFA